LHSPFVRNPIQISSFAEALAQPKTNGGHQGLEKNKPGSVGPWNFPSEITCSVIISQQFILDKKNMVKMEHEKA